MTHAGEELTDSMPDSGAASDPHNTDDDLSLPQSVPDAMMALITQRVDARLSTVLLTVAQQQELLAKQQCSLAQQQETMQQLQNTMAQQQKQNQKDHKEFMTAMRSLLTTQRPNPAPGASPARANLTPTKRENSGTGSAAAKAARADKLM
jgi:uncharacterized phage infection (PIP) family protein YhgE